MIVAKKKSTKTSAFNPFNSFEFVKESSYKEKEKYISKIRPVIALFYQITSLVLNFSSIILFIVESEMQPEEDAASAFNLIDFLLSTYFLLELVLSCYQNNQTSSVFSEFFLYVDAFTILTSYFAFIFSSFINLNFLRVIRALKIIRINKLLKMIKKKSNDNYFSIKSEKVQSLFLKICLSALVTVFVATGLIVMVGEIFDDSYNQKNIHFISSLYYLVISVTLIGYGDIVPTNIYSRILTLILFFTIAGVFIVGGLKLVMLFRLIKEEDYEFQIENHLVVLGNLTEVSVRNFMIGYFHEIADKQTAVSKIIFILEPDQKDIIEFITESPFYGSYLFYIIDDDNSNFSLLRVHANMAKAVFLINSRPKIVPQSDDFKLRIIANKLNQTKCDLYMQNFMYPDTEIDRNNQNFIYFLKAAVVSRNIFCKGYSTFICNLMSVRKSIDTEFQGEIEDYRKGTQMKIMILDFPSRFQGCNFSKIKQSFTKISHFSSQNINLDNSVLSLKESLNRPFTEHSFPLLIGLLNCQNIGRSNYIVFNPEKRIIENDDKGIFIFNSKSKLQEIIHNLKLIENKNNSYSFTEYCSEFLSQQAMKENQTNGTQARRVIFAGDKRALQRQELKLNLQNHIIILGYSDLVDPIVASIRVHSFSTSIVVVTYKLPPTNVINNLLKKFPNFQIIQGDYLDPEFLIGEINAKRSKYVVILSNPKENGYSVDGPSILAAKLLEKKVKIEYVVEMNNSLYSKFISTFNYNIESTDFDENFGSTFVSGKIVYSSVFEQLIAIKLSDPHYARIIESFINLNYEKVQDFVTNNRNGIDEFELYNSSTRIFSVPVPEEYIGKQFGFFLTACFSEEVSYTPLGVFVESAGIFAQKSFMKEAIGMKENFFVTNPRGDFILKEEMQILVLGNFERMEKNRSLKIRRGANLAKAKDFFALKGDYVTVKQITKTKDVIRALREKISSIIDESIR